MYILIPVTYLTSLHTSGLIFIAFYARFCDITLIFGADTLATHNRKLSQVFPCKPNLNLLYGTMLGSVGVWFKLANYQYFDLLIG